MTICQLIFIMVEYVSVRVLRQKVFNKPAHDQCIDPKNSNSQAQNFILRWQTQSISYEMALALASVLLTTAEQNWANKHDDNLFAQRLCVMVVIFLSPSLSLALFLRIVRVYQ